MSLASAFEKKSSNAPAAAFVPPTIVSAPPPRPPKGERRPREEGQEGGRKRSRSEMEGGRQRRRDDDDSDDEDGGKKSNKPRRAKETQERSERTVFVGHVPVSWTKKQLADLFQKHLNEARAKGEFVGAVLSAEEKVAEEKQDYDVGDDKDDEHDEEENIKADGEEAKLAESKGPAAKRFKKEGDSDAAAAEEKKAKADEAAKAAEKAKQQVKQPKKKASRDIESIRFRSIPVAALAIAPGSDFRAMAKAAFIKKSFSNDAGGTMNGESPLLRKRARRPSTPGIAYPFYFCLYLAAYIVFTSAEAVKVALKLNNTRVEGTTVLSNSSSSSSSKGGSAAAAAAEKAAPTVHHLRVDRIRADGKAKYDPKRTVFVGQVHFEAKEEELRAFFASKVSGGDGSIEGVRIVRDPATLKGKGIAYILFSERTHVAEALGANGASFRGRTLRVTRCIDTEKAANDPTYRATRAANLPKLSAAAAAKKRLFAKTSAGRRDAERQEAKAAGGSSSSSSGAASKPPSGPAIVRPAHMGATGDEVIRTKVAMKVDAHHRKKAQFNKSKAEGKERAKAKHQARKEGGGKGGGGKPAFNSKGEKVKGILKK
jgi:nucleolar protein 12